MSIRCLGNGADDLVFTAPKGGAIRLRNFRRTVFNPATEAVGLSDMTPHDLRDTAASIAISAGANVKQVQNMLGHASAAMTLDVYAGLFEGELTALADPIDSAPADYLPTGRRQMRPVSWAHMATSTRFRAPSFRMRLARWALTVLGVM